MTNASEAQANTIEEQPYGWVIVCVATICLTLGFGANVTVAVLIKPLEEEFGFTFAGVMTCLIICAREASPLRMAGLSVSLVLAAAWLGMGVGGYQAGYFFDLTGDYTVSFGNAAISGVINLLFIGGLIYYRKNNQILT